MSESNIEKAAKDFVKDIQAKDDIKKYVKILADDSNCGYIDTGSYSLNKIISGSYFNGIPDDKTVALVGDSNVGKSFILANMVRGAQEKNCITLIFDSERAVTKQYYDNIGVNSNLVIKYPITCISEFRNLGLKEIRNFHTKYGDKYKLFVALDSLGNVPGVKELSDAAAEKEAGDMGSRAKEINSALRVVTSELAKYSFPFVLINHVYENPTDLFGGVNISGGKKATYNPHIILHFRKSKLKEEDSEEKKKQVGVMITATTLKNRDVPEQQQAKIKLHFTKGMDKYYGLLPDALKYEYIVPDGSKYMVKHLNEKFWEKELYCKEVFDPILKEMDEKSKKDMSYSIFTNEQVEDVKNSVEKIENAVEEEIKKKRGRPPVKK